MKRLVIGPVFVPEVIGAEGVKLAPRVARRLAHHAGVFARHQEGVKLAPRVARRLFPSGSGFFERDLQEVFMATFD